MMKTNGLILLIMLIFVLAIPTFAQDSDNDGFPDGQDACPNRAAPNSNNGCPPPRNVTDTPEDRDGDGTLDVYDNCPDNGGPTQNAGCPDNVTPQPQSGDSDGDGFPDEQDACPNQAGAAGGCDLTVIDEEGDCVAATESGSRVNIRESALENAAIVGQLLPNETKLILGIAVSNNNPQSPSIWVQIDIGFINTSVIRIGGDCGDVVSTEDGEPTMTAIFALEYDCSTTPRVVIISDETPTHYYMGQIATYAPWWVYPDVLYRERPLPTEPDVIVPGNVIIGTPCDDLIIGTDEADIIDGLGGNDMIVGLRGFDALVGNEGNDQLLGMTLPPLGGETTGNILVGGAGNDILNASASGRSERMDGGDGDDVLIGDGTDNLRGGNGNDRLSGGTLASGGNGNDTITGTLADDRLGGNAGDDRISGSSGHDSIDGGDNNDVLFGNRGNDTIRGGNGRDIIRADLGSDTVFGGDGDDNIEFFTGGLDIGEGEGGNDRIDVRNITSEPDLTPEQFDAERGEITFGSYFSGGEGEDIIISNAFWEGIRVPITGDNGNDNLRGSGYLDGGNGNDQVFLNSGNSQAYGGEGDDTLGASNIILGAVLLDGQGGNDSIVGHRDVDLIFGGEGNDRLIGMEGGDYISGGNGDDIISGGPNIVAGTPRRDYSDSPNYIDSGAGRDTVDGGPDNDFLDTFQDTCIIDGSDTSISCEITSWPNTIINLVGWQVHFDAFGR